ncbi:MAG: hypothetical protein ACTSSP_00755 [Candidatus Asgardarchaeia archaeon]
MRDNYDGKITVDVNKKYDIVYSRLLEHTYNTKSLNNLYDDSKIEHVLFNDTKKGYIRHSYNNLLGIEYCLTLIDILGISDKKTNITLFYTYFYLFDKHLDKKRFLQDVGTLFQNYTVIE